MAWLQGSEARESHKDLFQKCRWGLELWLNQSSTCLANAKPRVQTPVLPPSPKKKKKERKGKEKSRWGCSSVVMHVRGSGFHPQLDHHVWIFLTLRKLAGITDRSFWHKL
jgi:hypothetical protein